jgi:NADP-dependent 3-hydroxy acid dehydrogenase YdfG
MTKTVAITGAASGIGQAACRRLLDAGWSVFGLDNARDRLGAVADGFSAYQERFRPVPCDVADAAGVTAASIPPGSGR